MKKTVGILLTAGLILSGCSNSTVTYDQKNFVDYYLSGRDYSTLNQLTSMSAADLKIIANIADGMTETDQFGNKVGALAESWTHNEDYTVWTFHLRDAVWSDQSGQEIAPVRAQDFVFAASYVLDPAMESYNAEYLFLIAGAQAYYESKCLGENPDFSMVGIKAVDDHTVEYTMEQSCPYLLSVLGCNGFYPVCESFVQGLDDPKTYGSTPDKVAYSGAFIIQSHDQDSQLTLVKNENYWDKDRVNFDTVTLLAVKDTESVLEFFKRGEISLAPLVATQVIKENEKNPDLLIQEDTDMMAYGLQLNSQTTYSEDVNLAMSNEDFRQSLFWGFDRIQLTELINPLNPDSILNQSFCPKGFVTTSDGRDYTELGGLAKYHDQDLFQLDLALKYKEKAMAALQAQGVEFPLVLKYWTISGDSSQADRARMIKEVLETNLGTDYVTVELKEYTQSFASEVRATGDYAITIGGWNPDYADPINCLSVMKTEGTINHYSNPLQAGSSHWSYPEFDALVEAADQVTDLDERYEAFANAEAYLLDHAYYIPLYVSGGTYQMTTLNEFTRMHSKVGIDHFKYKGLEAFDTPVTQEQYQQLKEEWEQAKNQQ